MQLRLFISNQCFPANRPVKLYSPIQMQVQRLQRSASSSGNSEVQNSLYGRGKYKIGNELTLHIMRLYIIYRSAMGEANNFHYLWFSIVLIFLFVSKNKCCMSFMFISTDLYPHDIKTTIGNGKVNSWFLKKMCGKPEHGPV